MKELLKTRTGKFDKKALRAEAQLSTDEPAVHVSTG